MSFGSFGSLPYGGIVQPLVHGPRGQPLAEQETAIVSSKIAADTVIQSRIIPDIKKIGNFTGAKMLDIFPGDWLFVKRDIKSSADYSPFSVFDGIELNDSATYYHQQYKCIGKAKGSFSFAENIGRLGKGITYVAHGVLNYVNNSGVRIYPGQLMTWMPDFVGIKYGVDDAGAQERTSKMRKIVGTPAVRARIVPISMRFDLDFEIKRLLVRAAETKRTGVGDGTGDTGNNNPAGWTNDALNREVVERYFGGAPKEYIVGQANSFIDTMMLELDSVIGKNAELTEPDEFGRIIL